MLEILSRLTFYFISGSIGWFFEVGFLPGHSGDYEEWSIEGSFHLAPGADGQDQLLCV